MVDGQKIKTGLAIAGKLAVRGTFYVGTNIAICGAGALGTLLYVGKCKNKIAMYPVATAGLLGTFASAAAVSKAVDDYLVDNYPILEI